MQTSLFGRVIFKEAQQSNVARQTILMLWCYLLRLTNNYDFYRNTKYVGNCSSSLQA